MSLHTRLASYVKGVRRTRVLGQAAIPFVAELLESRRLLTAINWIGGTGDWGTKADWAGGVVPEIGDDVSIPAGANVTISANESCNVITAAAGSTVTVNSSGVFFDEQGGTINGTFNWNGTITAIQNPFVLTFTGTTVVAGDTNGGAIANTGQMTFNGGGFYQSPFMNSGTVTVTGGILLAGGLGVITNEAGATFTITDDSGFTPSIISGQPIASGTFINEGTFTKSGGTGTSNFPDFAGLASTNPVAIFENLGGAINIDSGNFTINATTALQNGQITVATGSTLTFDCGEAEPFTYNVTLAGTLTASGGGTIALTEGSFYAQAPGQVAANATLNFPIGMVQVGDVSFQQAGGNTLTNTGFLNFNSTTAYGDIGMVNQGTIASTGTADIPLSAFVNDTTGILDLQTDAGLSLVTVNSTGLTNMGLIEKSAGTGVSVFTATFANDGGSLDVESGTISLQENNFENDGTISVLSGATLTTTGPLTNTGTLNVDGNVTVGGSLTESQAPVSGPTTPPPPTLDFVVDGAPGAPGAPVLSVQGGSVLAGVLSATVTAGFTPVAGASYAVATFTGAQSGAFASTSVGPDFSAMVSPTSIVLNVAAPSTTPHLVFLQQPSPVVAGSLISPAITVEEEDASNNPVTGDTSTVTLGVVSGTLGGAVTAPLVNGVATFGDVVVNAAGSYMLTAADGSDTTAASLPFTVSAAPTAVPTLTPTTGPSTLPASVVVGVKTNGTVTITVTNATAATLKGAATFNLFASSDGFVDGASTLVATMHKNVNLKAGKSLTIKLKVKSLPASLTAGTYTLLSQSIAPGGIINNATSGPTVQVAAPLVRLMDTIGAISPSSLKPGKSGTIAITITNTGNIPTTGAATFNVGFSTDGTTEAVTLVNAPKNLKIKNGQSKTLKIKFIIPAAQAAGTYASFISVSQDGSTTSAVGQASFVIA